MLLPSGNLAAMARRIGVDPEPAWRHLRREGYLLPLFRGPVEARPRTGMLTLPPPRMGGMVRGVTVAEASRRSAGGGVLASVRLLLHTCPPQLGHEQGKPPVDELPDILYAN